MDARDRDALLRDASRKAGGAPIRCASGSMEPTIAVGETVTIRSAELGEYRLGDVVVFRGRDGDYILHRLILFGPRRNWFLHIGDAPSEAGPRRAESWRLVGRTNHPRRLPPLRIYRQAIKRLCRRYLYW